MRDTGKIEYWLTTDTHLGHDALINYTGRPHNFSDLIMKRHKEIVHPQDVLIHLGDICMRNDARWHTKFMYGLVCKKWLIRGNHDRKSNVWYLTHGWDFVADSFTITRHGMKILFSHTPQQDRGYDVNIHGHFHNNHPDSYEKELSEIMTNKHRLLVLEDIDYRPVKLQRFLGV